VILFSCILARAAGVLLPAIGVAFSTSFRMDLNLQQILTICYSGTIRGAIAFALSLQISPDVSPNSNLIVSSTLVVVLVTSLLFGGLMSVFTKVIGLKTEGIDLA